MCKNPSMGRFAFKQLIIHLQVDTDTITEQYNMCTQLKLVQIPFNSFIHYIFRNYGKYVEIVVLLNSGT